MVDITKKRIMLIGGAGFIGHNLAIALKKEGADVHIVDSLHVNNLLSLASHGIGNRKFYWHIVNRRIELLHEYDIQINIEDARNYDVISPLIAFINPDVIIHLAAVAHANISNKDPHTTFDHSLRTLENTLDTARVLKSHFIYLSSSMVYGKFTSCSVTEETVCKPLGIYGSLKYCGELIVKAYNQVFDLNYTIVRPSAIYGERCISRRVGQIFIENAIQEKDISIKGDGSDSLDFTYIDDLVSGVIKVIENENSINQTFNLTYGESRTIGELSTITKQFFPKIKVSYIEKDKFTPSQGTLNIDKAKKLIGYNPSNPIDVGFPKYIEWYKRTWKNIK